MVMREGWVLALDSSQLYDPPPPKLPEYLVGFEIDTILNQRNCMAATLRSLKRIALR